MRTAILSDIHANREALAACLAHARREGAERYVFLGDMVGYGADPGWCLDTVMAYCADGAIALLGNHDEAVLAQSVDMNSMARAAIDWTRGQIDDRHRAFLASRMLSREEGDVLYVHASAATPHDWPYIEGPRDAAQSLSFTTRRITVCGHVHVPRYFYTAQGQQIEEFIPTAGFPLPLLRQRRWVIVLGAVGQPRDGNPAAAYGMLDTAQGRLTLHRVPYDIDSAARKIRQAGLPDFLAARLFAGS